MNFKIPFISTRLLSNFAYSPLQDLYGYGGNYLDKLVKNYITASSIQSDPNILYISNIGSNSAQRFEDLAFYNLREALIFLPKPSLDVLKYDLENCNEADLNYGLHEDKILGLISQETSSYYFKMQAPSIKKLRRIPIMPLVDKSIPLVNTHIALKRVSDSHIALTITAVVFEYLFLINVDILPIIEMILDDIKRSFMDPDEVDKAILSLSNLVRRLDLGNPLENTLLMRIAYKRAFEVIKKHKPRITAPKEHPLVPSLRAALELHIVALFYVRALLYLAYQGKYPAEELYIKVDQISQSITFNTPGLYDVIANLDFMIAKRGINSANAFDWSSLIDTKPRAANMYYLSQGCGLRDEINNKLTSQFFSEEYLNNGKKHYNFHLPDPLPIFVAAKYLRY